MVNPSKARMCPTYIHLGSKIETVHLRFVTCFKDGCRFSKPCSRRFPSDSEDVRVLRGRSGTEGAGTLDAFAELSRSSRFHSSAFLDLIENLKDT